MKRIKLIKPILIIMIAITIIVASGTNSLAHWYGYPYGSSMSMFGLYYPNYGLLFFGIF